MLYEYTVFRDYGRDWNAAIALEWHPESHSVFVLNCGNRVNTISMPDGTTHDDALKFATGYFQATGGE